MSIELRYARNSVYLHGLATHKNRTVVSCEGESDNEHMQIALLLPLVTPDRYIYADTRVGVLLKQLIITNLKSVTMIIPFPVIVTKQNTSRYRNVAKKRFGREQYLHFWEHHKPPP